MKKWVLATKQTDFNKIAKEFKIDPVTAALIGNRGIEGTGNISQYLYGDLAELHDPAMMKDCAKAIELLADAIMQNKRMRIIGDYDIDGVMSTYILQRGLRRVGATVDAAIPHRIIDGYGINVELIEAAANDGIEVIITCDNGIAAKEQIKVAKAKGMTVIVTDHHEVPYHEEAGLRQEILPPADAIINPKQKDCNYPFKHLCGAAVAYKLIIEMYRYYRCPVDEHEEFLEYVAIATIGDVMDLVNENRILVKEGLKRLQHTKNLGLRELIKVNDLKPDSLSTYHIGFVLGPCLNASGRLDAAIRALELLNTTDELSAAKIAGDLKNLNDSRKEMTIKGVAEAIEAVEGTSLSEDRVLVVYLPDCHESLAGIIAGRLRERYYKPTLILTNSEDGVKGSGRSIEHYSMYDELVKCQEFLAKFGGHPMAAGFSLKNSHEVSQFRERINQLCTLSPADLEEKIVIDVAMPLSYIKPALINELELLQPFGKGNNKPVFAQKNIVISDFRVFGKNKNVVKMKAKDENGFVIDAIYFGEDEELLTYLEQGKVLSITYYPAINSYMGRESLQIIISHYKV